MIPAADALRGLLFDNLGAPVLLIPGNHDVPAELERRFAHEPFQVGGTRVLGNWAVVMLATWFAAAEDGEGQLAHRVVVVRGLGGVAQGWQRQHPLGSRHEV